MKMKMNRIAFGNPIQSHQIGIGIVYIYVCIFSISHWIRNENGKCMYAGGQQLSGHNSWPNDLIPGPKG